MSTIHFGQNPFAPKSGQRRKIEKRQLELRARLFSDVTDADIWSRKTSDGFITVPRTMPLIMAIMDDMAKNTPVSQTYFELWCRSFDDFLLILNKPGEMAFHAGFSGQRAERTWKDRIKILADLGFIRLAEGSSGPLSYALILNPYHVIKKHYAQKHPGVTANKYNALLQRMTEIGAYDMDDPIPPVPQVELTAKAIAKAEAEFAKPKSKKKRAADILAAG